MSMTIDAVTGGPVTRRQSGLPMRILCHPAAALSILGISLLLTTTAWLISDGLVRERAEERFRFQSDAVASAISKRMIGYETILRAGAEFYRAGTTRTGWRDFVAGMQLEQSFPGIQGVGFAEMMAARDLARHVAGVRAEGFPGYDVWPEGRRDVYSAIVWLEPFDWRNKRAFGYDMYAEAVRRAAMDRAADSGMPTLSGHVILVQETSADVQHGILMYVPVYRRGMPLTNAGQRRAALHGFVYSPFRARDLMDGIVGADRKNIALDVYDGLAPSSDHLLYTSGLATGEKAAFEQMRRIDLGGRSWTLHIRSGPSYLSQTERSQPLIVALGGVVIDLLLFVAIHLLARRQKSAELDKDEYAALTARTLEIVEEERTRLSRELHDEIGQTLLALGLSLDRAHRTCGPGRVVGHIEQSMALANGLVAAVRQIAHCLRPSQLDELGLVAALRWHIDKVVLSADIHTELSENLGGRRLPPDIESCCFRVVQEAMNNILRHARAKSVVVRLTLDAATLTLSIKDDGVGFEAAGYHDARGAPTLGLLGMKERIMMAGGQCEIRSQIGKGTEVRAVFSNVRLAES